MGRKALFLVGVGTIAGLVAGWFLFGQVKTVVAGNDRHQDFILCTGPIITAVGTNPQMDGVWLLDYRAGKLLASAVGVQGRIHSWAEVDLVGEFGIQPRQDAHFVMTTGIMGSTSVLYVGETVTGKMGVFTMSLAAKGGVVVRRHDMVLFRSPTNKTAVKVEKDDAPQP